MEKDADYWLAELKTDLEIKLGAKIDWTADRAITDLFLTFAKYGEKFVQASEAATGFNLPDLTGDRLTDIAQEIGITNFSGARSSCSFSFTSASLSTVRIPKGAILRVGTGDSTTYWVTDSEIFITPGDVVEKTLYSRDIGAFSISAGNTTAFVSRVSGITPAVVATSALGYDTMDDDGIKSAIENKKTLSLAGNQESIAAYIMEYARIPYAKIYCNPNYNAISIGPYSLPAGNMMIVAYPNSVSTEQMSIIGNIVKALITPGTKVFLPADDTEGAVVRSVDQYNTVFDVGVIYAVKATLDIIVTITKRELKSTGVYYTVAELRGPITTVLENFVRQLILENPLGVTTTNLRLAGECVRVKGCSKVTLTVSVNGGSFTTNDLSLDIIEYPELSSVTVN
jgi:hypothetical protein